MIITIDGPGGAGKSTVASRLARAIRYRYLDTGAMYRAVAYAYSRQKPADLDAFLAGLSLTFSFDSTTAVSLDGEDISERIRTPDVALLASALSQNVRVRAYLTQMQRRIGKDGGIVAEGRDTGSVVFPDADVKFYLDADITERARRRHGEVEAVNPGEDIGKVREEMERRDRADSERDIAPLVRPRDAVYVDTTGKAIDDVVDALKARVDKALI
jgi:cytidylate kinase